MILFSVNHISGLSKAIALAYTKYKGLKCFLIMNDSQPEEYINNLEKNGVFAKAVVFKSPKKDSNLEIYEKNIIEYYDKFFYDNEIPFNDMRERISNCDKHDFFNIYCCLKKVHYTIIEGMYDLFTPKRYNAVHWDIGLKNLQIKHKSLVGENDLCFKRYRDLNSTMSILDKDEFFNFSKILYDIPEHIKLSVIKSYGIDKIKFNNLILPHSTDTASGMSKLSRSNPFYPYYFIMDAVFYDYEELHLKPHPRLNDDNYAQLFPYNKIINEKIPIEFFAYHKDFRINKAVVGSISTLDKIQNNIDEIIEVNREWLANHFLLTRIYSICLISKFLEFTHIFNCLNIESALLDIFCNSAVDFKELKYTHKNTIDLELYEIKENQFNILGDITKYNKNVIIEKIKNSTKETLICFLDNPSLLKCNDAFVREIIKYLIPIEIRKDQKSEYIYCDLDTEVIYIYCKDELLREKIRNFSSTRNFKYTGIEITINANNINDKIYLSNIEVMSKINTLQNNLNKTKKENELYSNEITEINKKYTILTNNLNKIFEKYDNKIENLVNKSQLLEENLKERSDELYRSNAEVRELKSRLEQIESSNAYKLSQALNFKKSK